MNDTLLIVDDNERVFKSLAINFRRNGYACLWAADTAAALKTLEENTVSAAILDLSLGSESGLDLMEEMVGSHPEVPVTFISGYGTLETAVAAMKMGAYDFLPKPLNFKQLLEVVRKSIEASRSPNLESSAEQNPALSRSQDTAVMIRGAGAAACGMVAESPAMRNLLDRAAKAADSDIAMLITGESGTGKELLAEFIHANSGRKDKPLIRVNCSAIADSLAESELFGHVKGAFTGADSDHPGYFQQANGGTLHLDEIGDMPLAIQAKMLRVLENSRVRAVGATHEVPVDVRIVASTNKRLFDMVDAGEFRSDLFYRVNAFELHLPPLRERPEDLLPLLQRCLSSQSDGAGKRFSTEAEKLLLSYAWPGNVRELKNIVKVCALLSPGTIIETVDLPRVIRDARPHPVECASGGRTSGRLDDTEKDMIRDALEEVGGNRRQAAKRLGISVRTLYYKLERYDIS